MSTIILINFKNNSIDIYINYIVLSRNGGIDILFKEIVKKVRKKTNMTQVEFSKALGIHPQVVSQYESGYNQRPAVRIAKKLKEIAKKVGIEISMDDIY